MPETIIDLGKKVKAKYPGEYDDLTDEQVGAKVKAKYPMDYADFEDVARKAGSAPSRFATGAASETFGTQNQPLPGNIDKALSISQNKLVPGYLRPAASLLEPSVKNIGGQMAAGNLAGGLGALASDVLTLGGPALLDRAVGSFGKIGPIVKNITNPVERKALEWAESRGIPMTVGQKTGQKGIQQVEAGLEHFPGSATKARGAFDATAEALAREGRSLAAQPSSMMTSSYGASTLAEENLTKKIRGLFNQANALYDDIRTTAQANVKKLQIGTKETKDIYGNKVTVPAFKQFESPVDLTPVREQLQPIYDELARSLPEAKRANSPAWTSLSDLMNSKQVFSNAMDFDRYLSAVKSLTRDGTSELLSSRSQGLARQIIKHGEVEFQKALNEAAPGLAAKMKKAREIVKEYHTLDEFRMDLGESGGIMNRLISGGDRTVDMLRQLKKTSPDDVNVMARTFLEDLVDTATKEGGFSKSQGIMRSWEKLVPETKQLLFGQQLRSDLDNFFIAAKKLGHPEGSRTAPMSFAMTSYGTPLTMLGELIAGTAGGTALGHPGAGLAAGTGAAAVTLGANVIRPQVLSRLLLTPGGARMLTRVINLPPMSLPAVAAARSVQRMISGIENENPQ